MHDMSNIVIAALILLCLFVGGGGGVQAQGGMFTNNTMSVELHFVTTSE